MTEEMKNAAGAQEATTVAEAAKAETVKEAPATFRFVIGEKVGMTQLFDEKGNLHGGRRWIPGRSRTRTCPALCSCSCRTLCS